MSKEWLLREASRGPCQGTFSSPKDSMLGFCHSAKNSRLLSKLIIWAAFSGKKKKKVKSKWIYWLSAFVEPGILVDVKIH